MAVKHKFKINREDLNNMQIELSDVTGFFSANNPGGYGGANGIYTEEIYKYMITIRDLNCGTIYKQYYGSDSDYDGEYQHPTVDEIQRGAEMYVNSESFNLEAFKDSLYNITLSSIMNYQFAGDGITGQDFILNVPGANAIANSFEALYVDRNEYNIVEVHGSTIFLDRPILEDFVGFYPVIKSNQTIVLSGMLFDCIDKKIAKLANDCGCSGSDGIDNMARIQFLIWGIELYVERGDYFQANEYLKTCLKLCSNSCC